MSKTARFAPTTLMLKCLKGVNIVIKRRYLVDWPRKIDPCTYFYKKIVTILSPCFCFVASLQEQRRKDSNFSNTHFSLKIEQIKVVACGKLHFTEYSFFFSVFHMTSQPQSFFFLSLFQDYISLCLIISFQLHTMKDYDAVAARTAGSVPSQIFFLMLLTCTSVFASA